MFFLKVQFQGGQVKVNNQELEDFAWVTKDEMNDYVTPEYYAAVAPTLLDWHSLVAMP